MKPIIIILSCLLLVSCTNNKYNEQLSSYNRFVTETKNQVIDNSKELPLNIEVYYEKLIDEEVMYTVIIDNPKENIYNIEAIAIHNKKTEDIYPTSGIFDTKLNLIPGIVNKKLNNVKGIILVGYIPYKDNIDNFNCTVKVLVKYEDSKNNTHKIFYKYQK